MEASIMDVDAAGGESKTAAPSITIATTNGHHADGGGPTVNGGEDGHGTSSNSDDVDAPNFDIEAYAARYTGFTKLQRLLFIAQHCKGRELDAYRLALEALKRGSNTGVYNTGMYKKVQAQVKGRLGEGYALDQAWVDGVERRAAATKERLEGELQASRTSMSKESIRLGYNDLGDFCYQRGDLEQALKNFVRTRDYCSVTRHNVEMCLNVVKVSVALGSFGHVSNYVAKAEHTPDLNDARAQTKLRAAAGLALLHQGAYAAAARKFLECDPEQLLTPAPTTASTASTAVPTSASAAAAPGVAAVGAGAGSEATPPSAFAEVVAPEDVAVYGGLCALATFGRGELKRRVVESLGFKGFLDLVPPMRDLLADFCASGYGPCLQALEALKPELLLDMHLRPHVRGLYTQVRKRCLLQFFAPYVSVDLQKMAQAFRCPLPQLAEEVAALVMAGRLPARIDSEGQALYRRAVNARDEGYRKAFTMGQEVLREVKGSLLRASLLEHGVAVEPLPRGGERGRGVGGAGGMVALLGAAGGTPLGMGVGEGMGAGEEEEEGEEEGEELSDEGEGDMMVVSGGDANHQDPDSGTA